MKNVKLSSGMRQSEIHLNCTGTFREQLMEKTKIINTLIRVFVIEEEPLEVLVVDEVVIKDFKEVLLSLVKTCKRCLTIFRKECTIPTSTFSLKKNVIILPFFH